MLSGDEKKIAPSAQRNGVKLNKMDKTANSGYLYQKVKAFPLDSSCKIQGKYLAARVRMGKRDSEILRKTLISPLTEQVSTNILGMGIFHISICRFSIGK